MTDEHQSDALHTDVHDNDLRRLQRRLAAGHDVECKLEGETPLHVACRLGHVAIVEALLGAGADVYALTTYRQESALYLASMEGRLAVVELLVSQSEALSKKEQCGALIAASRYGHHRIVQFLVDKGLADIDAIWGNGQTALTMAAQHGHGSVIRILLKAGCSPRQLDKHGFTGLTTAVRHQHSQLIPMLLDAGADPGSVRTSLHAACGSGDLPIVSELLKSQDCAVNSRGDQGNTALFTAAELGFVAIVEELLQAGADPNIPSPSTGNTAIFAAMEMPLISLYICPEKSPMGIVRALIRAGADPSHTNKRGRIPLGLTLRRRLNDVALLLLAAECNVRVAWWQALRTDSETPSPDGSLPQLLMLEMTRPRSLKRMCRAFLRSLLKSRLPYAATIGCLPVPPALKEYLLYGDI